MNTQTQTHTHSIKTGAGEVAQWLRALTALAEDPVGFSAPT